MASVKLRLRTSAQGCNEGVIYYQIIHDRVVKHISSGVRVSVDDWNSSRQMVDISRIMQRGDLSVINQWDRVRFELKRLQVVAHNCELITSDELVVRYIRFHRSHTLFGFTLETINRLKTAGSISNANNYYAMLSSFMTFRKGEDVELKELDSDIIECYEAFLKHKANGASLNTISFYMRTLRSTLNRAIEKGLMADKSLFRRVRTKMEKTAKRAVSIDIIKRIRDVDLSDCHELALSRDIFLFSFYTRGMSFVDIAYLKKRDLKNGEFTYRRSKTGQAIRVAWEPCMEQIFLQYNNPQSEYMLPIITNTSENPMVQYISMRGKVSRHLKKIAELAKVQHNITMYVARHTWASVAKSKNISISVISEAMGHDSEATTRIYLASLDTAVIDDANRLIIGSL